MFTNVNKKILGK